MSWSSVGVDVWKSTWRDTSTRRVLGRGFNSGYAANEWPTQPVEGQIKKTGIRLLFFHHTSFEVITETDRVTREEIRRNSTKYTTQVNLFLDILMKNLENDIFQIICVDVLFSYNILNILVQFPVKRNKKSDGYWCWNFLIFSDVTTSQIQENTQFFSQASGPKVQKCNFTFLFHT